MDTDNIHRRKKLLERKLHWKAASLFVQTGLSTKPSFNASINMTKHKAVFFSSMLWNVRLSVYRLGSKKRVSAKRRLGCTWTRQNSARNRNKRLTSGNPTSGLFPEMRIDFRNPEVAPPHPAVYSGKPEVPTIYNFWPLMGFEGVPWGDR